MIQVEIWLSGYWLSKLIRSGHASLPCISRWSWSSHFAWREPSEKAAYSASKVEIAMRSCFRDCYETAPLLRWKMLPTCDLQSALSLAQLESVYAVSWSLPPVLLLLKCSRKSAVDLGYWRTHLAEMRWLVKGRELYRQSAATANEIVGRVRSAS